MSRGCPNRAESRGSALQFGQNERLGDSAIRRFRISGCQPDRKGPGWAQRRSYAAHIFIVPSKHLELVGML